MSARPHVFHLHAVTPSYTCSRGASIDPRFDRGGESAYDLAHDEARPVTDVEYRALRERCGRLAATGAVLRALPRERIADAIARACRKIAEPGPDTTAVDLLARVTSLSPEMVRWALANNVGTLTVEEALAAMPDARDGVVPSRLTIAVLAGNVFSAALAAIALPLLAKSPVLAKASSREDVFPRLFAAALREADPDVAASLEIVAFRGGDERLEGALFSQADVVLVYGSDSTLADVRARLPATTSFVAHGHGLGAIFVPASVRDVGSIVDAIAIDVAAYDQRGCLSPHVILCEHGVDTRGLAGALAERGLAKLARSLPRGPLPVEAGAAQLQWRAVGATRGEMFEGDGYAVTHEGSNAIRLSPGYRNVSIVDVESTAELFTRLAPFGVHLKALGIAGSAGDRKRVREGLPPPLAPRITPVGAMQTPRFSSHADGQPPWFGLVRFGSDDA